MTIEHSAAGGIVVRKIKGGIKVLLIKDSYGRWTWPKGHAEPGETPEETALREVREETGIKELKVIEKAGEQRYSYMSGPDRIAKTVHVYLMETSQEKLVIQVSEISEGGWFAPEEALETIGYEGSRKILEKAIGIVKTKD